MICKLVSLVVGGEGLTYTPEKPQNDLKLLQKVMVWKFFSIDLEVTLKLLNERRRTPKP